MKTTQEIPVREHPYLAIMTAGDPTELGKVYDIDEIFIVSMISKDGNKTKPYVQYVNGRAEGWFTKDEKDYAPLPKGYKITIEQ